MLKEQIESGNTTLVKMCQYLDAFGMNTVVGTLEYVPSFEGWPASIRLFVTINQDQKMIIDAGEALLDFFRELIPIYDSFKAKVSEPQ